MEWVFDQQPWEFSIDNRTILLTWHNLRTSNESYELVSSLIKRKLPEANFSMNIKEFQKRSSPSLLRDNPFEEFIKIIKEDVRGSKANRRKNTLDLLLENGMLQNGDRISLLPSSKLASQNELITNATIAIEKGKPLVKWNYDNRVYSISKLTQIILVEIYQQPHLVSHHLNGTKYWGLRGGDKSLFAMANEVYKMEKTYR